MQKVNQRVKITKLLLKDALVQLLNTKKIDKISVTELCETAGINRATFYAHYNTPQDVLSEISKNLADEILLKLKPQTKDNILSNLEIISEFIYKNSDLVKLLIDNNSDHYFLEVIKTLNETIHTSDESKHFDDDSIKLISAFLAGGGYQMMKMWLYEDFNKTPKDIAQLIYDLFKII